MLEAYLRSYTSMKYTFLRGLGNSSDSIFEFAVHFNGASSDQKNTKKESPMHPGRLVSTRELLRALNTVFHSAVDKNGAVLNADHPALCCKNAREAIHKSGIHQNHVEYDSWLSMFNLKFANS
ncbi:uncharacterized protein CCR75_009783 [Bremia lactucae]|uniref:Uncharacterized protein n=1 Tax=Bremia lactucae TaxID=4779 RepID=A0A976IED4_BRELC|nr:hypothetical protein CCR75_009783 [Bremia lactucae]